MERYNRRMGGYEVQGTVEIGRCGCQQQTHRFVMMDCDADDNCQQAYRVTFRTEPCDGYCYELIGHVRKVQTGCGNGVQETNAYTQQNGTRAQRGNGCGRERNNGDHTGCGDDMSAVWTECNDQSCGEQACGCNRARQDNAFTYEHIRGEQKNNSLWDNWMRRGHN